MIARIWHGRTEASKAGDYLNFLKQTALPAYRNTKGNLRAYVLRRIENDEAHFLTLSFWESLEAIKGFAGEDYERARYYSQDKDFLLEFEPTVQHYELFD
ncbi:MAG: antibiotic biosynthesis monooxygenase family protein [Pyrinomonadaceae bacterium]